PGQALGCHEFLGELALSGTLRPVKGVLPVALAARDAGRGLILPEECAEEAALVNDLPIHPANHLLAVCKHLIREQGIPPYERSTTAVNSADSQPDLAEVRGQEHAKRALEIAAAGNHSLLMIGPPGTGKSMLACRLPGILPSMTEQESLETAAIRSISNLGFSAADWQQRPFRSPHHTASGVALVGGGSNPRPGEISLAHNGVLFLDELPEFDRKVLEVLREPLESGQVTISRAARQEQFPARFQLIAAMNPCPCGHLGDTSGRNCRCTGDQVARYRGRISGPLLDRIDMTIEVPRLPTQALGQQSNTQETSHSVRNRVEKSRQIQLTRNGCPNAQLAGRLLENSCLVTPQSRALIERAMDQLGLSARAYHRILRLARTIADMEASEAILSTHIGEAISYRSLDRQTGTAA
ncbi:MAG: YifB family Mg chelatase-like AAA ATPase, partial [Sedimenticola sp.]|nr:YifB family Mg chelatase-like AAA ATPase [Sedimenticola sp.]